MIWQEHVPVIVMITRLFEKNKVRKEKWDFWWSKNDF
jgi:protein tyrosine phosphatase